MGARQPHNDAIAVARFLQKNGFDVFVVLDGAQGEIEACAAQLAAAKSDIAMLYYSGHGVQFEYANYLMGADATTLDRSLQGFVSLDGLIAKLRSNASATLVFLDACRDNPLAATSVPGLAPEQVAPKSAAAAASASAADAKPAATATSSSLSAGELFVAFATSPNSTASDGGGSFSPFTESFLRHAGRPGWLVQRVVAEVTKNVGEATDWRQTPWSRSSLTREIYFNGGVDPVVAKRASDLKASESTELLGKGARHEAIQKALEGLPERYGDDVPATYPAAYEALWRAVRSRSLQLPVKGPVHALSLSMAAVSPPYRPRSAMPGARTGSCFGTEIRPNRSPSCFPQSAPARSVRRLVLRSSPPTTK